MNKAIVSSIAALIISGCAHHSAVSTASATNVYSGYDQKILVNNVYEVDTTSLSKLKRDDTVTGFQCSVHHFPVDATQAFNASIPAMMETVFENTTEASVAQTGMLKFLFRIERFEPRVKFNPKFFGSDADATVELGISVTGTQNGKRVFGTSVDSQRSRSGDAGPFCGGGAEVIAEATRDVIKDVLEKVGERLANSQQLRAINVGAGPSAQIVN